MARPHNAPDPFRAIAHPVRRRMLELLRQRPRHVAELAEPFHLTFSTITEHVRALRNAGLIAYRQRGARHEYSLVRNRLRPLERWINGFARPSPSTRR